ncbi:MAG: hypothetical protein KDM81_14315, partial [Verrucomicrobiae bacterium]|nr:hypothetical protein [Verrucomicrobiae bacterium]
MNFQNPMRSQAIVFLRPCSAAIRPRGFALIVTTSMLMLLALVAVGMLTLAGVTLRTSAQGSAQSVAHANARMALMLALGELQKTAGPDQRVTARADILDDDIANPRLTGAWKSWEIRANSPPQASDYEKNARDSKFLGWLVSSPQPNANGKVEFAHQGVTNPVTLWGPGTLGDKAPGADLVTAAEVNVGGRKGSFAWAVMDEGVKVRVNTPYHEESSSQGMLTNRLGSGVRPNTGAIPLLAGLDRPMFLAGSKEFKTVEKGITRLDFGLAAEELANGMREPLKELFHDVTTLSAGVLSDVAAGGLKEDFNLLANSASLPAPYAGKGVYTSRLGITGPSDPRWESLHELAGLYKNGAELSKHEGAPMLRAGTPARWTAARGSNPENGEPGVANLAPPPGLVLMPSIAKVQVVFSLLTRDIYNYPKIRDTTPKVAGRESEEVKAELHDPWGRNFAGSSYDYLLHLLYTPVVTIHNPYNVILEFSELKVVFGNVPFALQVIRNGEPQTHEPAPLDTMFYRESETGDRHKRFGMTLKT